MRLSMSSFVGGGALLAAGLLCAPLIADPAPRNAARPDGPATSTTRAATRGPGLAEARREGAIEQPSTTLDDQVDLALTVYNSNIALVRDVRELQLPAGTFDLSYIDIAATINPATVHFRSLTEPTLLRVIEQNYEYDLLEPQKLLQKYVGRVVTLVRTRQDAGTTVTDEVQARLLALNNGPVWQIGNEIVTGLHADHIRFPQLPDNLYSRPTMVWALDNNGAGAHRVEAAYLAGNLSWNADYVLTVDRDDAQADLDGWVTLTNNSGTAFNNARLQLVAGDLNRIEQDYRRDRLEAARAVAEKADQAQFVEESFSEYHLYTLGRRTSVKNLETKQVSLLASTGVAVEKRFVVDGQQFYYRNQQSPGSPLTDAVKVYFRFANEEEAGLGMPLPAGNVRVYQADAAGGVQFVGEDRIGHTPKDETLNVQIGRAFDVVAERTQTDFRRISSLVHEVAFEVTLRNHKDEPIVVEVNEPIGGDWQMRRATHEWTKSAAWAARFEVPVEAGGETVLRYRVRVRW